MCPYQIVRWTSSDNQRLRAIVRELLAGDKDDIDVSIDCANYKVIKIVDEDEVESGLITFESAVRDIEHIPTLVYNPEPTVDDADISGFPGSPTDNEGKASDAQKVQQEEKPKLNTLFD